MSFIAFFFIALQDFVLQILLVAAVLDLTVDLLFQEENDLAWIDGVAIISAVFIVAFVTAWNDFKREAQF